MAHGPASVDLNADLGERPTAAGLRDDVALLDVISSASVACGLHAGDMGTMRAVCAAAAERGVRIGAHLGYADPSGFGRRALDVPAEQVRREAREQLDALTEAAAPAGAVVAYVKPHGALYHRCRDDQEVADAIVEAMAAVPSLRAALCTEGSALLVAAARAGLAAVREGFADRAYAASGGLASRDAPSALLTGAAAAEQARALATGEPVALAGGSRLLLRVDSICVHSDTPGALATTRHVAAGLREAGIRIAPFT